MAKAPTGTPDRVQQVGVRDVRFGTGVTVIKPVNLYECIIEDEVFVGPFVEIQGGARIGARTRIQSHGFICSLVTIGQDCFVGHGVTFINDTFESGTPARGDQKLWKETVIGNHVSIGSNATVLPVHICSGVVIGAGAVVTESIAEPGIYAGNPARRIRGMNQN